MKVGGLEIEFFANLARLKSDMDQATREVSGAATKMKGALEDLKSVAERLGLGLSVAGIVAFTKGTIDALDHINDLTKSTGLAVEQLAGLRLAAKQSGTDLDGVAAAVNKLSVNMGKDAEKFARLGVTAKEPIEAFKQLADVFSTIQDPQLRAAVGAEALGKSWASAAPLLAEGGKKIGEMVEQGAKLSGITPELTKLADEFNDKLAALAGSGGFAVQMIGPLLPLLIMLADDMIASRDATKGAKDEFSLFLEVGKVIAVLIGNLGYMARAMADEVAGLAVQIGALMHLDFDTFAKVGAEMREAAERNRKDIDAWSAKIMAVGTAATSTAAAVGKMGEKDAEAAAKAAAAAEAAKRKAEAFLRGKEAAEKAAKANEDAFKAQMKLLEMDEQIAKEIAAIQKAQDDSTLSQERVIANIEFETSLIGLSNVEREKAIALRELETSGIDKESAAYASLRERLGDVIAARDEARKKAEAEVTATRNMVSIWSELGDALGGFLNALTHGFKSGVDYIRQLLKKLLADMIAIFATRWVLQIAGAMMGGSAGSALASAAASVGGNALSGALTSAAGSWLGNTAVGQWGTGVYSSLLSSQVGNGLGTVAFVDTVGDAAGGAAASQAAGGASYAAVAGWVAAIIAGMMWDNHLFSSGWRSDLNGQRQWTPNFGSFSGMASEPSYALDRGARAIGLNDRWASVLSGSSLTTRMFGLRARQNDAYGITGDITGSDITGSNWQDYSRQGGWFRSTQRGTDVSPLTSDQDDFLKALMRRITGAVGSFAGMVGVDPAAATAGYSRAFNLQLNENGKPLTDEQLAKLFGDLFGSVLQDQVALVFEAGNRTELADYVKNLKGSGDEITAQIIELGNVMQGLASANILGMTVEQLMKFGREGESLGDTFSRIAGQWNQYQNLFLSDSEKLAMVQDQVSAVFGDLGVAMPTSMDGFRALVDSLDMSTESGRHMFEMLMAVAPAFATVANAATAAVNRFHQLASSLSPAYGAANARSVLEARAADWMALDPRNQDGWTVDSTIGNIAALVQSGNIGQALTYAQSLGGNAVQILNDMLAAYIDWQNALGTATGPLGSVTTGLGDLGGAAMDAAARLADARAGLGGYLDGLLLNPTLSTLDPMSQLYTGINQLGGQFQLAAGGNVDAINGLPALIDQVLSMARGALGSSSQYVDLFNWIMEQGRGISMPDAVDNAQVTADNTASIAASMNDVRDLLIEIRDNASLSNAKIERALETKAAPLGER